MDDCRKCQTFAASPAEPGELLFLFSRTPTATLCSHVRKRCKPIFDEMRDRPLRAIADE